MTQAVSETICGAKKRQGEGVCTLRAGWGTDHVGRGRCKLHGGRNLVKHGRYSKLHNESLREFAQEFESDPDPLNLLPELAQARALYADYVKRCEDKPELWDPKAASALLSDISRAAKRIEDARAQNAISRPELFRLLGEMARVVNHYAEEFIVDPETRKDYLKRVRESWESIRLA